MQPLPLPGVPDPTAGFETEVERAGGEPSGDERETLGDVETRERVVRRRRWRLGSGGGGGRRSGRGGGGGTRGAGRRREKGCERVRVGTDRPRLFGLELQDFVVISGNGRVFLQNLQQDFVVISGVNVARHVCRETRRAKETGAVFHFPDDEEMNKSHAMTFVQELCFSGDAAFFVPGYHFAYVLARSSCWGDVRGATSEIDND
jgi:hypothetical protein